MFQKKQAEKKNQPLEEGETMDKHKVQNLQDLIDRMLTYIKSYTVMKAEENLEVTENDKVQDLRDIVARMLTYIKKYTAIEGGRQEEEEEAKRKLQQLKKRAAELGVEQRGEGNLENKYLITGIVVIVALSGIILARWLVPASPIEQETRTRSLREAIRVFNDSAFDDLQASFPHQTARFWRILRNRAAAHLKNPNPKKPLVFMFTAPPSAHNVLQCIARKFAQSLDYEDGGKAAIDSIDYTDYSSPDDAKKNLDDNLKEILEKGHDLLVLDVDQLPVQSPLLFYEYCDNENAPFKHAAIIFTVRLPSEPDPSLAPAKKEGLVAEYLREFWGKQDYRKDDVPPLVARITDTVVMVKKESNEVVKRNCDT